MDHIEPMDLSDLQVTLDEVSSLYGNDGDSGGESEASTMLESALYPPRNLRLPFGYDRILNRLPGKYMITYPRPKANFVSTVNRSDTAYQLFYLH
jgi:hypothetical protein